MTPSQRDAQRESGWLHTPILHDFCCPTQDVLYMCRTRSPIILLDPAVSARLQPSTVISFCGLERPDGKDRPRMQQIRYSRSPKHHRSPQ